MSIRKSLLSALLLAGTLVCAGAALAQEGVLFKVALGADSDYCHMKFPAIQEETLSWDRPVLKDPSEGDLIDFHGSCSYDPRGKDEIRAQELAYNQNFDRDSDDD
jgi:hypothetical protein